jgi:hypothetical protein
MQYIETICILMPNIRIYVTQEVFTNMYQRTKIAISVEHSLWEANTHSAGHETPHSMEPTGSFLRLQEPLIGS